MVHWYGQAYVKFISKYEQFIENSILAFSKKKLTDITGKSLHDINKYLEESSEIFSYVTEKIKPYRYRVNMGASIFPLRAPLLYVICRAVKPDIIIETGVASGSSTTFLLHALEKNGKGHLYSIDLPRPSSTNFENDKYSYNAEIPENKEIGWLVHENLKSSWTLSLGRSNDILPELLKGLNSVDIFIHDSDHSYEYMLYEFRTAWPFVKQGGYIMSDDIHLNDAFSTFVKECNPSKSKILRHTGVIRK